MKGTLLPNGILLVSIDGKIYGQIDEEELQSSRDDDGLKAKPDVKQCKDREPLRGF